jgi:hypothetical protein
MRKLALVLLAAFWVVPSIAQTGNTSNPSSQSGASRHGTSDTQSDRVQPSDGGKTGSSMHDTIITSDQQIQPSYTAEQNPEGASGGGQVPAGALVRASLDLLLTSKSSQAGDKFTATVSQPVRGYDGSSLIPTGTKIEGAVTRVEQSQLESSLVGGACKLEFRFDRMVLPNGATTPVNLTLVSVKAPESKVRPRRDHSADQREDQNSPDAQPQSIGMTSGSADDGAMKGVSVTSSPGGGYVTTTDATMVSLPPQTTVVLRFQHSTMVPSSALR